MIETQEYQLIKEIIPTDIEQNSILNIVTRDVNTHTHGFHKYALYKVTFLGSRGISERE